MWIMKFREQYEEVLKIMSGIWGGDIVERQRDNIVLQILASVPFYAGSSNPMRVTLACINTTISSMPVKVLGNISTIRWSMIVIFFPG